MAISFDAATDGGLASAATSLTYAHTVGTGSNRILFVGTWGDTTDVITGATYAGVNMTLIGKVQCPADRWAYLFYLVNPASGANNVVVSASTSIVIASQCASYAGVKQSGQPDASSTNTAAAVASYSQSVTTVAANCWAILFIRESAGRTTTAGANTVIREDSTNGAHLYDTGSPLATPGTDTMNISAFQTASPNVGGIMASFSPAVATSGGNFLAFM